MAIRRRGELWQVDVTVNGQRARGSFPTVAEARQREAEWRSTLLAGEMPITVTAHMPARMVPADHTISGALDMALRQRWHGAKDRSGSYRCGQAWVEALGPRRPLDEITTAIVADVIEAWERRGSAPATINRKVAALSVMLKTAQANGKLAALPLLPRRKEYEGRIRYLRPDEEESLLNFAPGPAERDLMVLSIYTGIRRGELARLTVRDCDLTSDLPRITVWVSKGDKPRTIFLTARAAEAVKRLTAGLSSHEPLIPEGITPTHLSRLVAAWKVARGLPPGDEMCWHSLRHTCASRLVQRGVPLIVVKEWMGHAAIETTMRYAHLAPDNLLIALEALDMGDRRGRVEARPGIEPGCMDLQSIASTTPPTRRSAPRGIA